jgi:hypothetical protein
MNAGCNMLDLCGNRNKSVLPVYCVHNLCLATVAGCLKRKQAFKYAFFMSTNRRNPHPHSLRLQKSAASSSSGEQVALRPDDQLATVQHDLKRLSDMRCLQALQRDRE